jgi:hypothetical protein
MLHLIIKLVLVAVLVMNFIIVAGMRVSPTAKRNSLIINILMISGILAL